MYSSDMNDPGFTAGLLAVTIAFCIILILLLLLLRRRGDGTGLRAGGNGGGSDREAARRGAPSAADADAVKPCPLCSTMLKRGERVKTVVYPGNPDSMAHIFGCPYCYPPSSGHRRICPVCKKELADDGYIVARMFEGREKKHVHVLGCTGCRRVR